MAQKKYLIWDFDGTLGYRVGDWTGALEEVLQRNVPGCSVTRDHLRPHIQAGFPWHEPDQFYTVRTADQWWADLRPVFERAFAAVGVEAFQANHLAGEVRQVYTETAHWQLYDDAIPTLTHLAEAGWTHMLLSNHVPELSSVLEHLQIDKAFARVFNSAETGYEKPHPEAYRAVLQATPDAEALWMIGDNPVADIAGAAAAGIPGILVRKHHPDARYQCDDLSQVPAILLLYPTVLNSNGDSFAAADAEGGDADPRPALL